MKIQSLKAVYPKYRNVASSWRTHLWQIVVEVRTDTGVVGYGYGGGGLASLPIINGHFSEILTDMELNSPSDVMHIWDRLYYESIPYGRKGIAMMAFKRRRPGSLGCAREGRTQTGGGTHWWHPERSHRCVRDGTRLGVVLRTWRFRSKVDASLEWDDR